MTVSQRKRFIIAAIMTAVLYSPTLFAADPCDDMAGEGKTIVMDRDLEGYQVLLSSALINYDTLHADKYKNGTYYLCFDFVNGIGKLDIPLLLSVKANHNVYVGGLKISRGPDFDTNYNASPLLTLRNDRAGQTLELRESQLANVVSGIALSGSGKIELRDVEVSGDGSRLGSCVTAASPGALLDNVTASSCNEGVAIAAPGVRISASKIFNNRLGVHVMDSFAAEIERTLVYGNRDDDETNPPRIDGIRFDNKLAHGISLMKNEKEPVPAGEDVVEYSDAPALLQVAVPKGKSIDGKIELLVSDDNVYCFGISNWSA